MEQTVACYLLFCFTVPKLFKTYQYWRRLQQQLLYESNLCIHPFARSGAGGLPIAKPSACLQYPSCVSIIILQLQTSTNFLNVFLSTGCSLYLPEDGRLVDSSMASCTGTFMHKEDTTKLTSTSSLCSQVRHHYAV